MIETDFHIITSELFDEVEPIAAELEVTVDYYLMEFCQIKEGGTHKVS